MFALVRAGLNVTKKNRLVPILHDVARNGSVKALQFLIDSKANVDATCLHGQRPIDYAKYNSNANTCVKLLLDAKANADFSTNSPPTEAWYDSMLVRYGGCPQMQFFSVERYENAHRQINAAVAPVLTQYILPPLANLVMQYHLPTLAELQLEKKRQAEQMRAAAQVNFQKELGEEIEA